MCISYFNFTWLNLLQQEDPALQQCETEYLPSVELYLWQKAPKLESPESIMWKKNVEKCVFPSSRDSGIVCTSVMVWLVFLFPGVWWLVCFHHEEYKSGYRTAIASIMSCWWTWLANMVIEAIHQRKLPCPADKFVILLICTSSIPGTSFVDPFDRNVRLN